MSRNFRISQVADAFRYDSTTEAIEQLVAGYTNVRRGSGAPTITAEDGDIYYDTSGRSLYVRDGGRWDLATEANFPSIQALLDALPQQSEYTYSAISSADYFPTNGDAFHDGTFLSLAFRDGYTIPRSIYGFLTAPPPTPVMTEPDLILANTGPGVVFGNIRVANFSITRGTLPQFELGIGVPGILNTLYSRVEAMVPEVLTKTAGGDYEFQISTSGSGAGFELVNTLDETADLGTHERTNNDFRGFARGMNSWTQVDGQTAIQLRGDFTMVNTNGLTEVDAPLWDERPTYFAIGEFNGN